MLASRIAKELEKSKHCGIYEPELSRIWQDFRIGTAGDQIASRGHSPAAHIGHYGHVNWNGPQCCEIQETNTRL